MTSTQLKKDKLVYLDQQSFIYQQRNYIAGYFGGFVQALIGQPFDTIKVRLQSSLIKVSPIECLKNLIQNEGPLALYKGIGSPLICLSGVVAIQFGVFSHVVNLFKQKQNLQNLPIYQMAISGGICGLVSCSVLAPMEHIRIRLQVIKEGKSTSAINAFKHIYMQYGLKGIYKGLFITILRETPAMFIYFGVYNWMIRYFQAKYEKSSIVYQLAPLFSGALAGIGYWSIIYPVDTVKSKIQTDSFIGGKYKGSLDCFQKTIKTQGIKQLFRGFGVTNLRAVPVNAGSFFVYESVKIQIEKQIRL